MGFIYPLIFLGAFLFFVLASVVSAAAMLVWPVVILSLAAALLVARQPFAAARTARYFLTTLRAWMDYTTGLFTLVSRPVLRKQEKEYVGNDHRTLPNLWAFAEAVARDSGVAMVDEILVVPESDLAVADTGGIFWGVRRHLVFGVPLVYALTPDELRAVLAHEFGHYRGGHTRWLRLVNRFAQAIAPTEHILRQGTFYFLSPLYWSTFISLATFESLYHRWSRQQEYDADRHAAKLAGANHLTSALEKVHRELPAMDSQIRLVNRLIAAQKRAPLHVVEATARLAAQMSAVDKHRLMRSQGNVLFYDKDTHPPKELRIRAIKALPEKPATDKRLSVFTLPDVRAYEERLSRRFFHGSEFVPASEFVATLPRDLPEATPVRKQA